MKMFSAVAVSVLFSSSIYAAETNVSQTADQAPVKTSADTNKTIIKSDLSGTFYKRTLMDSITAVGALGVFHIL